MAESRTDAVPDAHLPVAEIEEATRRAQLGIIRKTSGPGAVCAGIGGAVVLAYAALADISSGYRLTLVVTGMVAFTMSALWFWTLRACSTGDLTQAFKGQFFANLITAGLFLFFVEDAVVLGLSTAFVGVFTGASMIGERQQKMVWLVTSATVILALAGRELDLVEPVVFPPLVLYVASLVGIIMVFRTPVGAQRMFDQHLTASRSEALRLAKLASEQRDRADAQARDLEEVTEELRAFTYFVSHDLRAPLINIEGFANVLEETLGELDERMREPGVDGDQIREDWQESHEEIAESLQFISSGTVKLNALVGGLLELSRIDSRPAEESRIEVEPLVAHLIESVQHQIRERGIDVAVGTLPAIDGDPLRVGQVFGNLIDNAIKYMPDRDPRRIEIVSDEQGEQFVFSVIDSGVGIDPDKRSKVFRPFQRLDAKNSPAGEGLGLAAVRKIVERGGGRIWVEEAPNGQGASFRFSWPIPSSADPVSDDRAKSAA